jgi:hypothetical protein
MSMQAADTSVGASVVVEAPIERAFSRFTEGIGTWWDPDHHLLEGELAEMVFEPRVGGHVYDRGVDGSECRCDRIAQRLGLRPATVRRRCASGLSLCRGSATSVQAAGGGSSSNYACLTHAADHDD